MAAKDTNDDAKSNDSEAGHSLDMSQAAVKKMIGEAREKGYITYDQLNTVLPPDLVSSEQIEDVMSMLSEMGINIIEDEEAKAVVEPFAIIDVKARGFFLMEGAWRPHVALSLIGLSVVPNNLAPHHLRQAGAVTQFFQKSGGQAHGFIYRLGQFRVQRR